MKQLLLSTLIVVGLVFPKLSYAKKLYFQKEKYPLKSEKKVHPIEKYLSGTRTIDLNSRDANKLLVLLIEFQEDNDPQTTGNGKFVQDPGDYPITFGKPPHDHEYFVNQLEALRYYYLAVSYGSFEVEIDVFPQSLPGDFQAYTLPHEMSYYNPPGADPDLMVSRFEEYFLDAFTKADEDENIDFSQYEHFMFIHAGADWQHDIFGDTPADIPSFFIKVGEGKEAIVDDGFIIDHACNIPETITQDIQEFDDGLIPEVYNYGVINAAMVHEFGHSIGFVDLYNTKNNTPQVGYFDIMDSGGSILLGFGYDENGDEEPDIVYYMEGTIPGFPCAWSRTLAFEDTYRARGILKDISDFNFDESITVLPAEKIFEASSITDSSAYFIKVPLNDTEYILIENRQVDPDGDGGTYIWTTEDQRIILYPTYPPPNPDNSNNYEYDYLHPGWLDEDGNDYGGGLLIWHIDEKILEENNNFENNTVNIYHSHRAVKIIEADNIDDIGNPYSMYWYGTAYEPYFKYMPIIDEEGYFIEWDDKTIVNSSGEIEFIGTIFNESLSAVTEPALITNTGNPSVFSIYDISSYSIEPGIERVMTFKFGTQLFDGTEKIAEFDSLLAIGSVGSSYGFPTFPLISENGINFFSRIDETWQDNFGVTISYENIPSQPIFPSDTNNDEEDEYSIITNNILTLVTPENIEIQSFPTDIIDVLLYIEELSVSTIATIEKLFINDEELNIPNARLAYNGSHIIATSNDKVYFIDPENPAANTYVAISNLNDTSPPVCYTDTNPQYNAVFIQNENGNIYKIQNSKSEEIFRLSPYTSEKPSQLAIGDFLDDGQVYLVFGAGNRAFAITLNGTLAPGFPAYLDDKIIKPESYPRIIKFNDETILLFEEKDNGYIGVNRNAKISLQHSFYWQKTNLFDQFYWDELSEKLYYIYADANSYLYASYLENITEDPIIWNGFRNNNYSLYSGSIEYQPGDANKLTAYAFPNPAKNGEVRIRVQNAKNNINLKVFDIAGNIIHKVKVEKEANDIQDIRWNTSKVASGVYFGIIKSKGEVKKTPIAIIN
ncbi:MAG: T9SS type A sorting domain-containing protein [Candidatus Cloacimonetes bacterium]|nr:T9SS type A sorting domain-containing protein [Candidatus Cloacimonadota bacterium]